ncbi:MAG: ATP-binding protein [Gemmatimonadota bacterium]
MSRIGPGWVSAWATILALALWLAQLTPIWFVPLAIGSAVWTGAVLRRRARLELATAALLWLALGAAAGVQYRLVEVVEEWPALQLRVEESSAAALGEALDELLERGERAVEGAEEAASGFGGGTASAELFTRLEVLQRSTGVSAIALYDPEGSPLAWAGEHRGAVPLPARQGTQSYLFHEGPLFSYLYFVRQLPDGVTATASFLLEASVDVGEGVVPFADRFESRYGTRPRFWLPERARAASVWDWATDRPILSVSFVELTQQHWWERVVRDGRRGVGLAALAVLLLLSASWYRARVQGSGVPVLVGTAALLIAPLGPMTGAALLFSPLQFVLPGPLDITLGVLLVLLIGGSLWLLTRTDEERPGRLPAAIAVLLLALIFPLALSLTERSAADGLLATRPAGGLSVLLAASLLIAVPTYLIMRSARVPQIRGRKSLWARGAGFALPVVLGLAILLWWRPGHPIPIGLAAVWALPALLLLAPGGAPVRRRGLWRWLIAGWLAGTAALAFLWPLHVRAELARAEREIALLGAQPDPFLDFLLRQLAEHAAALASQGETGVNLLYNSWVGSGLAREGYEARVTFWEGTEPEAELNLSELSSLPGDIAAEVAQADRVVVRHYGGAEGLQYLLVAPLAGDRAVSVAIPPRRRVGWATPLARFLHPEQDAGAAFRGETLYLVPVEAGLPLAEHAALPTRPDTVHWVRTSEGWRSETLVEMPEGNVHAHMVVSTPGFPLIVVRGVLVQTALLLGFLLLWLMARTICRELSAVPFLQTGWLRSFRGRLSLALFFFFLLPTLVFGAVSYGAVAREVVRSAAALAQQALDQAAARMPGASLPETGAAVQSDLLLYRNGSLVSATAPELLDLGLFHTWLPPAVHLQFAGGEILQGMENQRLAENDYLVAFRRLDLRSVLAAPIPLASHEITRRQREFRDITLLVILLGLGLSVVLALLVSRALSRPLDELTRAAGMVGAGNFRTPLPEGRGDEFGSVYASFNRMVRRLRSTRAALVKETRRTETIVAEAATGVLALDGEGRVELVNPRATEILGMQLRRGDPLLGRARPDGALAERIEALWASRGIEAGAELELEGRIVRLRLRRLSGDAGEGGAVVALEDVTDEVRTARVLAWGEMARQVAHEIKNPLTPIKLAVQHVRRAYQDGRADFGDILDRNVDSILREIDRLGEISRAFSRFGTPAAVAAPLEPVDVLAAIREVLTLYSGSADTSSFRAALPATPIPMALSRPGELKEVLLNLLENAREAVSEGGEVVVAADDSADGWVRITVSDAGVGISADQLPHIFEPHFSTRSSGTGLGLAIVRRIVDSWGGAIRAESRLGVGSRFEIRLPVAVGQQRGGLPEGAGEPQ